MAESQQAHDELIGKLAKIFDEKQLKVTIRFEAERLVGVEDEARLSQKVQQLQAEVDAYNAPKVDAIGANFVQQYAETTAKFGKDGYAGQSSSGQVKLGVDPLGNTYTANLALSQDQKGNPAGISGTIKAASKPIDHDKFHTFVIGSAGVDAPLNESSFGPKNANVFLGTLNTAKNFNANLVVGAGSDLALKNPYVISQISSEVYKNKDLTFTPYTGASGNLRTGGINVYGGVRADYKDWYLDVSANHDIRDNSTSGQLTAGKQFGIEPKKVSELEQRLSKQAQVFASVDNTSPAFKDNAAAEKPTTLKTPPAQAQTQISAAEVEQLAEQELNKGHFSAGIDKAYQAYKMLGSDSKAQQTFVIQMAENLSKNSTVFSNPADARQYLEVTFDRLEHTHTESSNQELSI